MLKVTNLVKEYKDVTAVNNISFSVKPGKIFGLLGPNGAGKTTTIRTVLNIIKPTSGEITYNNKTIGQEFFNIIGYLPEERGLYKKSKVEDVLIYFAELKNLDKHTASGKIDEWLQRLNIIEYRNKKVEELSKGNQQKVQFISAVLHDPEILILDEPFSGFDPINQQQIRELISSFVDSGKYIILSTHQMETAEKMCSEIFLINKGKEVCSGELTEIKKRFSSNNIKLGFEGDAKFLSSDKRVLHYDHYNNYAEVQLNDDIKPSNFLKSIVDKLTITHFSVVEPTLNKIFIDVINQSSK
ncbi:MAG TPA: ATP-binding cassette domain-containing protein [Ignavibacteriaceae bacterium]|nr:ATP-binding cassette domain-containing protein [Ignavibacteriaceae bacterium]